MAIEFKSIEDEQFREYVFPGGEVVRVYGIALNVSSSGGHRIKGSDGFAHYIPSGWIHLRWMPKNENEMFAF